MNSETTALYSMDTSSQLSMISSPSSTTTSSSPPGSAAILCSPPSSLQAHQGIFVDILSGQGQAGSSQADEEETTPQVCLWEGCNQEFQSLPLLVSHLDKGHTLAMSQYICYWKDCTRNFKPFDARYKLITHLRCHTGEKPFKCELLSCNRCFSRLENLKLHVRTHTGEKPYECHYEGCAKRFNNTSDRAKHMKTHVTRKPYACKYPGCEKSYTDPSSMRKHIKYSHKLKERQERGSSSGNSCEAMTSMIDASSIVPFEASSSSGSSARTPSLSPSSFVFHSPTGTPLSPPIHSPHASLPQESARIAHSSANLKRRLMNGTQLIATGPAISNQPQLIPIPLVQLPAGSPYQNQLLGLIPGGPQVAKGMILMPMASSAENLQRQHVIQIAPQPTSIQSPVTSTNDTLSLRQAEQIKDTSSQQNVEAQLRQKIVRLQQELCQTQTLLAHQNAIAHQNKQILRPPMLLQHVPPRMDHMTTQTVIARSNNGRVTLSSTASDRPLTPLCTGVSVSSLTTPTTTGSPQFIPLVNSQGFQFLYTPSIPHSSV